MRIVLSIKLWYWKYNEDLQRKWRNNNQAKLLAYKQNLMRIIPNSFKWNATLQWIYFQGKSGEHAFSPLWKTSKKRNLRDWSVEGLVPWEGTLSDLLWNKIKKNGCILPRATWYFGNSLFMVKKNYTTHECFRRVKSRKSREVVSLLYFVSV